jgi:hypothetical protein
MTHPVTLDQLRALHLARPFLPFVLQMADGSSLRAGHPECLSYLPGDRSIRLFVSTGDTKIVAIEQIVRIEGPGASGRRGTPTK